ncbi:MAG: ECF RNA polymerase sigma factor SigK [Actinomycetota bacterium]|nr:ECF RNA polymerase sigma factor SigK [Actinomycetota bacterium]
MSPELPSSDQVPTGGARRYLDLPSELMERVAGGDVDAFAELYDAMAARVYGLIRRLLRDPAQSEEITQEVMLTLWRSAGRYNPAHGSITTWTLTIAHRRAVDRIRSEESRRRTEHAAAAGKPTAAYDQTAEQAADNLDRQLVQQCLTGLTDTQREAITMAYYQGYTYAQVADILDAGLPAIKSRIRAGLQRLHTCLEHSRNVS